MRRTEGIDMVVRNLGLDEDEVRAMFKKACYVHNKEAAVAAEQAGRPMEEIVVLRDRCIKAFLLFLVCCTIFSN
jgi:hypothetical protein